MSESQPPGNKWFYKFSNGFQAAFDDEEAKAYMDKTGAYKLRCFKTYGTPEPSRPRRSRNSDAWTPGYDWGLGRHFESKRERSAELKRRGLIEIGNEKPRDQTSAPEKPYLNDDAMGMVQDMGVSMTEGEVQEIRDMDITAAERIVGAAGG